MLLLLLLLIARRRRVVCHRRRCHRRRRLQRLRVPRCWAGVENLGVEMGGSKSGSATGQQSQRSDLGLAARGSDDRSQRSWR